MEILTTIMIIFLIIIVGSFVLLLMGFTILVLTEIIRDTFGKNNFDI